MRLVRDHLGDDADRLLPLKKGGVGLLKNSSTMGDTCNTQRSVMAKICELKDESGIDFFGEKLWKSLPPARRMCLVFLCGNHTRGLPMDELNRAFDQWLRDELGEAFKEAAAFSGSRSRLEASGTAFLRLGMGPNPYIHIYVYICK